VERETILFALGVLFAVRNICTREKFHQPRHFFLVGSFGEFGGDVPDSHSKYLDGKSHDCH